MVLGWEYPRAAWPQIKKLGFGIGFVCGIQVNDDGCPDDLSRGMVSGFE